MTDMEALKITPINKVTPQQALRRYRNSPLSLILRLLVTLSAILTVAVLLFLFYHVDMRAYRRLAFFAGI